MKLRNLANPVFWATCGISLGLAAISGETLAAESYPRTSGEDCLPDPALVTDVTERTWIRVEAKTRDQLPVAFDLHLTQDVSAPVEAYDELICANITNHLYRLAVLGYQKQILERAYHDLPETAPAMEREVVKELNNFLATLESRNVDIAVKELEIRNAEAPGLSSAHALAMLTTGIRFSKAPDIGQISALTWDFRRVNYQITIQFQPKEAAWYAMGPDDEGIRRRVFEAAREHLIRLTATRESSCLKDDLQYISADSFHALNNDPVITRYIYLFGVDIDSAALASEVAGHPDFPARPSAPVCITALAKKYGAAEPAP